MQLRWQIRRLHRRISIHLTAVDEELHIAMRLPVDHFHGFSIHPLVTETSLPEEASMPHRFLDSQ